jgi:AcrR family transcriptional regulator
MTHKRTLDTAAVVRAAGEIADQVGLDQLTLALVAQKLNIRVPSLYNHVDGLAGLRQALALAGAQQCIDSLRKATVGKAGREALLSFMLAYRAFAQEHPGLYAISVAAPRVEASALYAVAQELLELMGILLAPYQLDQEQAYHCMRGIRSFIHGFVMLEAAGGFGMPISLDQSFQVMAEVFIDGIERLGKRGEGSGLCGRLLADPILREAAAGQAGGPQHHGRAADPRDDRPRSA